MYLKLENRSKLSVPPRARDSPVLYAGGTSEVGPRLTVSPTVTALLVQLVQDPHRVVYGQELEWAGTMVLTESLSKVSGS